MQTNRSEIGGETVETRRQERRRDASATAVGLTLRQWRSGGRRRRRQQDGGNRKGKNAGEPPAIQEFPLAIRRYGRAGNVTQFGETELRVRESGSRGTTQREAIDTAAGRT